MGCVGNELLVTRGAVGWRRLRWRCCRRPRRSWPRCGNVWGVRGPGGNAGVAAKVKAEVAVLNAKEGLVEVWGSVGCKAGVATWPLGDLKAASCGRHRP